MFKNSLDWSSPENQQETMVFQCFSRVAPSTSCKASPKETLISQRVLHQGLCLVMEYVPGGDMLQDIIRQGRFLEAHAQRLVRQCLGALSQVSSWFQVSNPVVEISEGTSKGEKIFT